MPVRPWLYSRFRLGIIAVFLALTVFIPANLTTIVAADDAKLNRLLQQLAWTAVTEHPLSGVKRDVAK